MLPHSVPFNRLMSWFWKGSVPWHLYRKGNHSNRYISNCTLCFKPGDIYLLSPKCRKTMYIFQAALDLIFKPHLGSQCLICVWEFIIRYLFLDVSFDPRVVESSVKAAKKNYFHPCLLEWILVFKIHLGFFSGCSVTPKCPDVEKKYPLITEKS